MSRKFWVHLENGQQAAEKLKKEKEKVKMDFA